MKATALWTVLFAGLAVAQRGLAPQPAPEDPLDGLVQRYLWSTSDSDRKAAEAAVTGDASLASMSRERFHDLEEAMRRGRASFPALPARITGGQGPPENLGGKFAVEELTVDVPAGPP